MYYGNVLFLELQNMACEPHRNIYYGLVPCLLSLDHGMGIKNYTLCVNSQNDEHISLVC